MKAKAAASPPKRAADARRLQHELEVHQIELEMQNEELRAARAEIEAALETYTNLYDFAPVGYFTLAADGTIRQVNLAGAKMEGIERSRLLGRRFGHLVQEGDRDAFSDLLAQVFTTGDRQSCELSLVHEGLGPMTVRLDATLAPGGGECRVVLGDITERRRAEAVLLDNEKRVATEAALRVSEERYRALVDHAPTGIFVNADNQFAYVNDAFCRIVGASSPQELLGKPVLDRVQPEFHDAIRKRITQVLETGQPVPLMDLRYVRVDGTLVDVETVATPITLQGRRACQVMVNDITRRKRAERRQTAFAALGRRLNAANDETEAARIIVAVADELFGWDSCKLELHDAPTGQCRSILTMDILNGRRQEVASAEAGTPPTARQQRVLDGESELILREEPLPLPSASAAFGDKSRPSASLMAVPVREAGHVIGVLSIQSYRLHAYTQEDLDAFQDLADHCAGALERIRSRTELERQRRELELILDTVPGIVFYKDRAHRLVRVNEAHARALGLPRSAIEGRTDSELGSPHEAAYARDDEEVMRTGKPKLGIIEPQLTPTGTRWLRTDKVPYRDEHGNITGVLGFALDVTEHWAADVALRVAEDKYRSIFEHAVEGIYQSTPEGRYLTVNPAMAAIYGYPSMEAMLDDVTDIGLQLYADPADRQRLLSSLRGQEGTGVFECQMRRKDGAIIWVRQSSRAVRDSDGEIICFEGSVEDVTERKRAEASLHRQHTLLSAVVEGTSDAVFAKDLEGRYLLINSAGAQALGRPVEEILGRMDAEFVPAETARRFREVDEAVAASGQMQVQEETGMMGGELRSWHANKAPLCDAAGHTIGIIGVSRDITERKQAEAALRASEQRYAALVNNLEGIVWEADAQSFQFTFVNEFAEKLLGYPLVRWFEPNFWSDHIHPEDREYAVNYCLARTARGAAHDFEYRMIAADGRTVWLHDVVTVELAGDKPITLRGVMVDVTGRKQAEAELRETEARLRLSVTALNIGLWDWNLLTNEAYFSPEWKSQIGCAEDEIAGNFDEWRSRVHPDDLAPTLAKVQRFIADPAADYAVEFRLRHKDGSWRWIFTQARIFRDEAGKALRIIGCHIDITERKQAETALRASEERFRTLVDCSPFCIHELDTEGRLTSMNRAGLAMMGVADEAAIRGVAYLECVIGSDLGRLRRLLERALQGEGSEFDFTCVNGRHFQSSFVPIKDDRGAVLRLMGITQDITERKRAEAEVVHLSGRLLRAQDDERRHLARELHDSTAQILAALAMNLAVVGRTAAPQADQHALLAECESQVKRATTELRTFAYLLHPPALEALGLARSAQDYAEGFAARSGITVTLDVPGDWGRLATETELTLFRVLQESLGNIHRHSGSATAAIRLSLDAESVLLEVRDTGRGLNEQQLEALQRGHATIGVGIAGMRERLRLLGGRLEIGAALPGVVVRATLPLADEGKHEN